jgi:tetratricopeptide (TPR) repeat protein
MNPALKPLIFFLSLLVTTTAHSYTTYTFDQLFGRITTHPDKVEREILTYQQAALKSNNRLRIGKAYFLLGEMYYSQAQLLKSARALKKSQTIFRELGDEPMEARSNQAIGSMYLAMENFPQALIFQRRNLAYQLRHGDDSDQANAYFNIASTKASMRESDSAFFYYRKAETIYTLQKDQAALARVYLMTGYLHFSNGNPEVGLAYEKKALAATRLSNDPLNMQGALYAIASIYKSTKDLDSAKQYFLEALALSGKVRNPDIESEICRELSAIYDAQDSVQRSHYFLDRATKLRDSLLTPQKIHSINAIDFSEKKERASWILWIWICSGILFVIAVCYFVYHRRKPGGETSVSDEARQKLEARINHQQKELMTKSIRLQQQEELIERTKTELTNLDLTEQSRQKVRTLLSELKSTQQSSNWSEFERYFNDVHLDFYKRLLSDYPQLTVNERRLCGFISLNLSNKEISEITRKSVRSIEVAKYRLRAKMEISKEQQLAAKLAEYL